MRVADGCPPSQAALSLPSSYNCGTFSRVLVCCNSNMSEMYGSYSLVHPPRISQDKEQMIREGKGSPQSVMSGPALEPESVSCSQVRISPPTIPVVLIQRSGNMHCPNQPPEVEDSSQVLLQSFIFQAMIPNSCSYSSLNMIFDLLPYSYGMIGSALRSSLGARVSISILLLTGLCHLRQIT